MSDTAQGYFTDRELGPKPRTDETINERVWGGLYALIQSRLGDDSFGYRFPSQCPDGYGASGTDSETMKLTAAAEIPDLDWPLSAREIPPTPVIMDLLEFLALSIGETKEGGWHSFFNHHHLSWDRAAGLKRFVVDVNRLFARNGVAFTLTDDGLVQRILPESLRGMLSNAVFHTGDAETDRLLEAGRKVIFAPAIEARRDGLEKLWDAFERIKTLEPGKDKRQKAEALLDRAAGSSTSRFREVLGREAASLTEIGNTLRIRHSETSQEIVEDGEHIDYLFQRMFAFIRLLLAATGRGE